MADKPWSTGFPAGRDSVANMPDLANLSDAALDSHFQALRDALIQLEGLTGSDLLEAGSIRAVAALLSHPDLPPAVPSAWDDEFDDLAAFTANWTWVYGGAPTAVDAVSGFFEAHYVEDSKLYIKYIGEIGGGATWQNQAHACVRNVLAPAGPWTVNCKLRSLGCDDPPRWGIFADDVVGTGIITHFHRERAADTVDVEVYQGAAWSTPANIGRFRYLSNEVYLRLKWDGADFWTYASVDGENWACHGKHTPVGWGANKRVGLFARSATGTHYERMVSFENFRLTEP